MIKGIAIKLHERNISGFDEFNHPIYTETTTIVENVLVAPISVQESVESLNLTGKKAVYNIAIPKNDTHDWKDKKVEFFGSVWQVIGFPKTGIEENIPLAWNQIWMVTQYE